MDTSCYARCADCDEIKPLAADGVLHDHTRFRAHGMSVAALRCPGSGRPPRDAAADGTAP
jgi:hypothetical protein